MLKRFGTWMYRYRRGLAMAVLVAGLFVLLLLANGGGQWIEMAFWQSQAQACGSLSVYVDGRVSSGDPQAATTCFMRAYAHCRVATLVASFSYASGVVHTSSTYTFLIEPQLFAGGDHPCSIQLNAPPNSVMIRPQTHNDWVACADVAQRSNGLRFSGCYMYGDICVSSGATLSQPPFGEACRNAP